MPKKIIISVTNDLVTDMRVHKIALTLLKLDYNVLLVGRKLKNSKNINRPYLHKRFKLIFKKGAFFYAEYNFRLFLFLLFKKTDVLLANDLDSLLANFLASKIKNKKLVYDSHEYFTEVPELVNRKKTQKIWLSIEKFILPKIKHSYTVCQSIADIYNQKYGIDMKVVRNIPICSENNLLKKENYSNTKIIIYQGAVNVGRGIELVVKAMQYLDNHVFWIIGGGDVFDDIKNLISELKLENKVKMFGKLPFDELKKYTQQADIGISLEQNMGLNYYYALPNKLFDYIHSEIPILASPFPEMKRIIDKYDIGEYILNRNPKDLAKQIAEILQNESKLNLWKQNLKTAHNELCWQKEESVLKQIY